MKPHVASRNPTNVPTSESASYPQNMKADRPRRWSWRLILLAIYLLVLLASAMQRAVNSSPPDALPPNQSAVTVPEVRGEQTTPRGIRIAYADYPGTTSVENIPILLIHGSPGSGEDQAKLAANLEGARRLVVVDLPGFGNSTREVADYSIRAHAIYMWELLNRLGVNKVHLVAHSMGGGVVLNMAQLAPERVASISLVSAIGVQELELLGDYHVNHLIHGMQLVGLRTLKVAMPRFGSWNRSDMGVPYARNFYDSDQRPLRGILEAYSGPTLILHGNHDPLVPVDAAYEHARLVPQSKLVVYDGDHFTVFTDPKMIAGQIIPFLASVENGTAPTRATAEPIRKAQAALPMDRAHRSKLLPVTAIVLFLGLAVSTLISEDLACIAAGLLVSDGRVGFLLVTVACLTGIFVGDMMLFLLGKFVGQKALATRPLCWFVSKERVANSFKWLEKNGAAVIFTSRFIPGTRLPTYLAAGMLHGGWLRFSLYFLISAAVWTPLLVGSAAGLFTPLMHYGPMAAKPLAIKLGVAAVLLTVALRLALKAATFRGRRELAGWFYRKVRWEFWPPFAFYPPVFLYLLYLGIKFRGFTVFTAANPAIVAGGFIGESKYQILKNISGAGDRMLRFALIPKDSADARKSAATSFLAQNGLSYPVILKPDAGQRGSGVAVVRSERQLHEYLANAPYDTLIQEFAPGQEFGVFYYRYPGETRGHILSITQKNLPILTGDGKQTLEHLILSDDRAVCMADFYCRKNESHLERVPTAAENIQLVELGTHCRGAIFLDGNHMITPELTESIDRISQTFPGFYFGRYDVRTPSLVDFKAGRNFKVVELNGVSSEATDIYDPKNSLWRAYRVLFKQWRIAFEIGSENRKRGTKPATIWELEKLILAYRDVSQAHGE